MRSVHVVVLAAGRGSRLRDLGAGTPKWLLEVGGRPLAARHLEGIDRAHDVVASVSVVVGHAADGIRDWLRDEGRDDVVAIDNPEYAEINNWWSLLRALRELPEDGPVAVINADLMVDPAAVEAFLREVAIGDDDALLAVDLARTLTDESMKVSRSPAGSLERIGKVGIEDPVGEYIGMLAARDGGLAALRAGLEAFVDRDECVDEWYEGAVGRTAAAGTPWAIWPMPDEAWVEIDDDADLEAAEALA